MRGKPKKIKESEQDSKNPIKDPILNKIESLVTTIIDKCDKLEARLDKIEILSEKKDEIKKEVVDRPAPVIPPIETSSTITEIPVPPDYRAIVNEVLNEEFEIEMSASADRPEFDFRIIVPEKYSDMDESQKEMFQRDVRSRVVPYAEGSNGVRKWAERVFSSFNPDMKTKIKLYTPEK